LLTLFRDRHAVFASVYCRVRAWGRRRGTLPTTKPSVTKNYVRPI
jgi:hypothetical protein